ncbi:MAG: hypothetical protein JXR83_12345 [Deltaproteobacteria bacterium]|nr:hypothetical protein [Deltaproteobacteria bacterium]
MTSRAIRCTTMTLAPALLVLALTASLCGTPVDQEGCTSDENCQPNFKCDLQTGQCKCTPSACDGTSEFCNDKGFCQERSGCFSNDDCTRPFICDITTGECIDPSRKCALDTHCPFTYFCSNGACVPGCLDSGDCPLGSGCRGGVCVVGACGDRYDCELGDRCVNNECRPGLDERTCHDCSCPVPGVPCTAYNNCVAGGQHTCLINTAYDPADSYTAPENYCTPNCNTDEDCANGFACADIYGVIETCTGGPPPCSNGTQCVISPEQSVGYCPCTGDSDCTMMGLPGPCTPEGLCLAGRSCGIYPNLYCRDVGVIP